MGSTEDLQELKNRMIRLEKALYLLADPTTITSSDFTKDLTFLAQTRNQSENIIETATNTSGAEILTTSSTKSIAKTENNTDENVAEFVVTTTSTMNNPDLQTTTVTRTENQYFGKSNYVDDFDSIVSFTGSADANLTLSTENYKIETGPGMGVGKSGVTESFVSIEKTVGSKDLTDRIWVLKFYIDDPTLINQVEVQYGTDSSNYYSYIILAESLMTHSYEETTISGTTEYTVGSWNTIKDSQNNTNHVMASSGEPMSRLEQGVVTIEDMKFIKVIVTTPLPATILADNFLVLDGWDTYKPAHLNISETSTKL